MSDTQKPTPSLYRRHFTRAERRSLSALPEKGLSSEINLLRVVLARNFALAGGSLPSDIKSQLLALRARANAASLIASLLRTQVFTLDAAGDLDRAIQQALAEVDPYLTDE